MLVLWLCPSVTSYDSVKTAKHIRQTSVRENVQKLKNVKCHVFWILKKKR